MPRRWYWMMTSMRYGPEEFGSYDTENEAQEGVARVQGKAKELNDDIKRVYSAPYQKVGGRPRYNR